MNMIGSCFFFCKDTNFLANHNSQQSQQSVNECCFFFCKDTNFLANHNTGVTMMPIRPVVSSFAKILIF